MATISKKPEPFNRPTPIPIRSPASKSTTSKSIAHHSHRGFTSAAGVHGRKFPHENGGAATENENNGAATRSVDLVKDIKTGTRLRPPSPFSNSTNRPPRSPSTLRQEKTSTRDVPPPPLQFSTKVTLEPSKRLIPDQSPAADVFYQPPTPNPSHASVTQLKPDVSTVKTRDASTSSNANTLFKPPAPPSQLKRPGTPILAHARPVQATQSQHPHRPALGELPSPFVSNVPLNSTGPVVKRRKVEEIGAPPAPSPSQTIPSKQATKTRLADRFSEYRAKYTRAFPNFVFCFDAEFLTGKKAGDNGWGVKECKDGIKRMGGVSRFFASLKGLKVFAQ